ncbi:hypothetical protein B0H16DRAFT_1740869 [Mycena metata]|uniref:Uncharacterized protein n=1 Tax=Mycena metata TaxID=1033252 RepID=A0AAD7HCN1_9AGAR|nr:hypothetical protein B0H16DRAFT_1740869 [Mycena metata]
MALQTEVPTSTSPSSAGTASAAATGSSDSSGSGFSLSASPPLILAFLAVGVFGIAMVVFCVWRRMAIGRRHWEAPESRSPGEPPKLWDVWSPPQDSGITAEWHNIQPLAATTWNDRPSQPVPPNDMAPRYDGLLAEAVAHLRRRYRPRRDRDVGSDAKAIRAEQLGRLQIAVTIAMPCPDLNDSRTEPDEQPLDYAIGLYEIPWKTTH